MRTGGHIRYGDFKQHPKCWSGSYYSWLWMHKRCRDKTNKRYGARGIKVCGRWSSFSNFYEDMGDRPEGMTLDRKNSNQDYDKDNCRWADKTTQNNNRRSSFIITHEGISKSAAQWSLISPVSRWTIINRIRAGWSPAKAIFEPAIPEGLRTSMPYSKPDAERI